MSAQYHRLDVCEMLVQIATRGGRFDRDGGRFGARPASDLTETRTGTSLQQSNNTGLGTHCKLCLSVTVDKIRWKKIEQI